MNTNDEKKSKIIERRHAPSVDRNIGHRQYTLDTVPGLDVPPQYAAQLRDTDPTVSLRPHDVDADDDRHLFLVGRQSSRWLSVQCSTLANCVRTPRHRQRPGNTGRPDALTARHQTDDRCERRDIDQRRGQALIEMAFLIPILVLIIGATISFGLFFFQANVLQQAVDVGAQEISRFPFAATGELGLGNFNVDTNDQNVLMNNEDFMLQIYDEKYLVIHDSEWAVGTTFNGVFRDFAEQLPLLNRLLVPVMVRDDSYAEIATPFPPVTPLPNVIIHRGVTRFPGAVVTNSQTGEETVLIPIIGYSEISVGVPVEPPTDAVGSGRGAEQLIEWVAPVEEIRVDHDNNPNTLIEGPFSLNFDPDLIRPSFVPGMVALRINYPAQSTTLVNRTGIEGQVIIEADDASLSDGETGSNYSLVVPAESGPANTTINSGRFGLGRQAALLRTAGVRPYRKVLSVQAIYRREVFE